MNDLEYKAKILKSKFEKNQTCDREGNKSYDTFIIIGRILLLYDRVETSLVNLKDCMFFVLRTYTVGFSSIFT